MKGKWIRLTIPGVKDNAYYIKSLLDDYDGLKITIWDGEKNGKLILIYFQAVESYRCCDEHSRIQLFKELDENYEEDFYANYNLFKVENSNYIEWLNKSSCGITKEFDLQHYVLMDRDSVIDIISYEKPEFKDIK